jgi:hypothetical protein
MPPVNQTTINRLTAGVVVRFVTMVDYGCFTRFEICNSEKFCFFSCC